MFTRIRLSRLVVLVVVAVSTGSASSAIAQIGASSMTMGLSRAGLFPPAAEIRIEEFINYHQHDLPLPDDGRAVELDLRWQPGHGGRAVVQAGLATARALDPEIMPPLNLVLVIDRSGSMSGERIANVKSALLALVDRLRPKDRVALVSFSSDARVDLEPQEKTRRSQIARAIEQMEAGGSTNLHAGLMLGYRLASGEFDPARSNRVILLTDGIANTGVIDSAEIARESRTFNRKGIELSTIGLGFDLNRELLRELAAAGRGLIHFVGDSKDIEKTFVVELDSLLAPAARNVRLELRSQQAKADFIYGYRPESRGNGHRFRLDNLNRGTTQVVLTEWETDKGPITVEAVLTYVDAVTGEKVKLDRQVTFDARHPLPHDTDLAKNHAIAIVAESIRKAASAVESDRPRRAARILSAALRRVQSGNAPEQDADLQRMTDIAKNYRSAVRDHLHKAERAFADRAGDR